MHAARIEHLPEAFSLNIRLLSTDRALAQEVARACRERGHALVHVERLRDLRHVVPKDRPHALLLDLPGDTADSAEIAAAIQAVDPDVPIVLVADAPTARSCRGFRLVDRWSAGERLVDALELAHIGIPAAVNESTL